MKVEILPNVVNNLSALASLPESGDIKIEYITGGDDSDLIFIATSKTPITSLNNSEAQDSIYCDRGNKDSDRTITVSLGEQVYIWYKSTKTEKTTLLVNANQNSATSSLNSVNSKSTQHGELLSAQREAITQISAEYGITDSELSAALGGATTSTNGLFEVSTSTSSTGVAAIISAREGNQAPGQSMTCILNAAFDTPQANSNQQAGFIQSESALAFGYNGTEFGILRAYDGQLEYQQLTVTTGSTVAENASVEVDGVTHVVPLNGVSNASVDAYDIAAFINENDPRYRATAEGAVVTVLANLPDFGGGAFSFTSGTAVASWVEITNGAQPTEEWTPLSSWNVKQPDLNPQNLNEYMVKVDGNVNFYIKNSITGEFDLVHCIRRLNNEPTPLIRNPTFRVGWGVRNTGNTTNITLKGSFGAIFNEGEKRLNSPTLGATNTQIQVGTSRRNIVSFRNKLVYQGVPNRSEILPILLSFSTESNKATVFEVIKDPTVAAGSLLDFQSFGPDALMEAATNNVIVTGGQTIASFTVLGSALPVDIEQIVGYQIPGSTYAITGRNKVENDADLTVSGTWKEDR